ncbi:MULTISPECIES: F0F1 ATP synthase subunit gamma [Actibacterium]|uniref:F-type H+-transporting ATPase subunit gamma n=1 Tax=Actibacterium naphthalenivorans TaxID=1614693 RepID=A0A840CBT3_9RHOB|nr:MULTISPECIES: FoF1 ATP synthase subunit gamma [Actibacterium]ALG89962.1 ATPase [Actibacterium sp. EMB200-NS6]MBB4020286.1 F-type H+-transporting ATPase subunit gamma [Actibacterium naphthalenivorans]
MTRPEEIRDRMANIREIESIVSTLRALAVAHQLEARAHLEAIRAHEAIVAQALSAVLSGADAGGPKPTGEPGLTIVVGAAQGFSGAFGERMADAAMAEVAGGAELMVIGGRTLSAIVERGQIPVWSTEMAPHALEVPALASRLSDILFERLGKTSGAPVTLLFADPATADPAPIRRTLFPFDFSRFPPLHGSPPLTTLSASALVSALVEEYVFAELCEALMLGFSAENAARAAAMSRAQSNVKRIATDLKVAFQRARQEQMTTEIIELSTTTGEQARAGPGGHPEPRQDL